VERGKGTMQDEEERYTERRNEEERAEKK